jgi:hypothetical protein
LSASRQTVEPSRCWFSLLWRGRRQSAVEQSLCNADNNSAAVAESNRQSLAVSLAFWITLTVAFGMFAVAALSSRLTEMGELRNRADGLRNEMLLLDERCAKLVQIRDALRDDPEFAARWARADFATGRARDETVLVDAAVTIADLLMPPVRPRAEIHRPWWLLVVSSIESARGLNRSLFVAGLILTIVAFTFLQDSASLQLRWGIEQCRHVRQAVLKRYTIAPTKTSDIT